MIERCVDRFPLKEFLEHLSELWNARGSSYKDDFVNLRLVKACILEHGLDWL